VSRFLTAQQHNLGYLVPLKVKNEERESNHKTMWQRSRREKLKITKALSYDKIE